MIPYRYSALNLPIGWRKALGQCPLEMGIAPLPVSSNPLKQGLLDDEMYFTRMVPYSRGCPPITEPKSK